MSTPRALTSADLPALVQWFEQQWGADCVVGHGRTYTPAMLSGFVVETDGAWQGVITYEIVDGACEIVTLDSRSEGRGIGAALIEVVAALARAEGCSRLWLITTNDNLNALRFYQKRGFRLVAVHPGAVDEARRLKPSIPLIGNDGIPLHDELELERAP